MAGEPATSAEAPQDNCRLLSLPPELLALIFGYCFAEQRTYRVWITQDDVWGRWDDPDDPPETAVLYACKRIQEEAKPIFHQQTRLDVDIDLGREPLTTDVYPDLKSLGSISEIKEYSALQHVQDLELSIWPSRKFYRTVRKVRTLLKAISASNVINKLDLRLFEDSEEAYPTVYENLMEVMQANGVDVEFIKLKQMY
ncbi:uncharacterized protein LTR77_000326 [Saxophila tyrrhenica]|uniref:F-box domain-containing protein n=1 Tax=Saxophila tyrrhenica TaxID=1690608 RepID=A0AAV9PMC8_9PEZI|nr:hypothetical protein LTR77_000326 [Saxophila tyrrhenica]